MKRVPERNEPENLVKIFWHSTVDFAFEYDRKCYFFQRFAPKRSDYAFKYDGKCPIFSGASRQNIAILPLNMVKMPKIFRRFAPG